jgi:hypothetical protein
MIGDRGRRIDHRCTFSTVQHILASGENSIYRAGFALLHMAGECPIFRSGLIPPTSSYNLAFGSPEYVHIHPCWPKTKRVE